MAKANVKAPSEVILSDGQKLVKLMDKFRTDLACIQTVADAKDLADQTEAVLRYLKKQHDVSLDTINDVATIQVQGVRKGGQLLMPIARGAAGRPEKNSFHGETDYQATLKVAELSRPTAWRWQVAGAAPETDCERYMSNCRARQEPITLTGIIRITKQQVRDYQRQQNQELTTQAEPLESVGTDYQTIVIDPPWDWGDEGDVDQKGRARPKYATLSLEEIAALPVGTCAAENAHLYLWITNRSLPKGFGLLRGWGFRYVTCLTWCKPSFGMGNYFRGSTEQVLFGVKGSLPLLRQNCGTWFQAKRPGKHSSKPSEFYELVESCSPGPWLEMFARFQRKGWKTWGAEA